MIIRRFLLWVRTASPSQRAEAVEALAHAYLHADWTGDEKREAQTALTSMLDDPSPLVRHALVKTFADSYHAPRHIIIALANDQSDISAFVLSRSPLLGDADLIDCAALGDELSQIAIAMRPSLSVQLSAALSEIGCFDALVTLARNHNAEIAAITYHRMVTRFGDNAVLREALLERDDISADVRQAITMALSKTLSDFVQNKGWMSEERCNRAILEAREKTTMLLSLADTDDVEDLVTHLRHSEQLTPALILRAVLSGNLGFTAAALSELSGASMPRVAAILHDRHGSGFKAIYQKAGLPDALKPVFEASLRALHETGLSRDKQINAQLSRTVIARVLDAYERLPAYEGTKIMALLRRFDVEAARHDAYNMVEAMADDEALAIVQYYQPHALMLEAA